MSISSDGRRNASERPLHPDGMVGHRQELAIARRIPVGPQDDGRPLDAEGLEPQTETAAPSRARGSSAHPADRYRTRRRPRAAWRAPHRHRAPGRPRRGSARRTPRRSRPDVPRRDATPVAPPCRVANRFVRASRRTPERAVRHRPPTGLRRPTRWRASGVGPDPFGRWPERCGGYDASASRPTSRCRRCAAGRAPHCRAE